MTAQEIAEKYVYGKHDALTDRQEIKDMITDIEQHVKEQLTIPVVVDSEAELCGKPNCNRQKLDNSPLCSYHWDIANS